MVHALGWQGPVFIDTVGHCAGAILFGLLFVLLLRDTNFRLSQRKPLSLVAAALVFGWNASELVVLSAGLPLDSHNRFATYFSFCCLGVLPAVLLHISLGNRLKSIAITGYAVSLLSIASQYPAEAPLRADQSRFSLLLLTFGFALLSLGVWLLSEFTSRKRGETGSPNRVLFLSLFILATSYVHFQSGHTSDVWVGEAVWHHASIPIALLVLLQDFRFFLLDVFLRFTVSAVWIAFWVWAALSLNASFPLSVRALDSEFFRALGVTCICLLVYLLARSLGPVQRIFTSVAFRRLPLDALLTSLQSLGGESEEEVLASAATSVASHYRCRQWSVQMSGPVGETGPIVLDSGSIARGDAPRWALLGLALRFARGASSIVYLGPRAEGRRFLSADLQDLHRVSNVLAERIERFRNEEVGRLVREAELRALQAQINPHFLFNALNTLYGTIGRGSPEARQLVLNLAEVFRARLQTNRTYVALNEEIELVRAYLEIEGLRLGRRLQSEIDVDPALGETDVPVLSVQPLVENAIRHGADKTGNVRMTLRVHLTANGMAVQVADRGQGFSSAASNGGTGTGLNNVRKRLELCYGSEGGGLRIDSSSHGSTVSFRVPIGKTPSLRPAHAVPVTN